MSDNDSERLRLERKRINLLNQKEILRDKQKEIRSYEQYYLVMKWSNYSHQSWEELKRKKEVCLDKEGKLNCELKKLRYQIQNLEQGATQLPCPDEKIELPTPSSVMDRNPNKSRKGKYGKAIHKSSNKLYKYARQFPKGTKSFLNDEELEAYLVDFRLNWYESKSFNWQTHLKIWLKTWCYVLIEIGLKQRIVLIIQKYQPLQKPRLPK